MKVSNVKFNGINFLGQQIKLEIPENYTNEVGKAIINELRDLLNKADYEYYHVMIYAFKERDNIKTAVIDSYYIDAKSEDACKIIANYALKALVMDERYEEVDIQYSIVRPEGSMCVLAEQLKNGRYGFIYF